MFLFLIQREREREREREKYADLNTITHQHEVTDIHTSQYEPMNDNDDTHHRWIMGTKDLTGS